MKETVIHIPTNTLVADNDDADSVEASTNTSRAVLEIEAPDGRCILSIQKLVEES